MADPVTGLSFSLQQLKLMLDAMKFYERMTNDLSASALIVSVQATIVANIAATQTLAGYSSVLAQSATGVVGSAP